MSCTPTGKLKVKCTKCGHVIEYDCADIDMSLTGTDERAMGTEYHHDGTVELECPKCKNNINVEIYCCEYPVGTYNYHECQVIKGDGEVIECCGCEVAPG